MPLQCDWQAPSSQGNKRSKLPARRCSGKAWQFQPFSASLPTPTHAAGQTKATWRKSSIFQSCLLLACPPLAPINSLSLCCHTRRSSQSHNGSLRLPPPGAVVAAGPVYWWSCDSKSHSTLDLRDCHRDTHMTPMASRTSPRKLRHLLRPRHWLFPSRLLSPPPRSSASSLSTASQLRPCCLSAMGRTLL